MILKRLLARVRNHLLLGLVAVAAALAAALWFQSERVDSLKGKAAAQQLEINSLSASVRRLENNYAVVRGTLDYMAADEQETRRAQSYEEAYVLDSPSPSADDPSNGWNDFFDFLRQQDGVDPSPHD